MSLAAARTRNVRDVAIVGAGMVGAALALRLARSGFDVALLESRPAAAWRAEDDVDLRVVALAASARRFLDAAGVWPQVAAARASPCRRMEIWDALAPGTLRFDAQDDAVATLGYIVENRLLQHVLWQALQSDPRVTLHCPARVHATELAGDRRVLVLADGSQVAAQLIIAADGGDSALRELAGIATSARDYAQRAIVAHVVSERPHQSTAWQRFVPGATLAFLPLGAAPKSAGADCAAAAAAGRRSSIVWSLPSAQADRVLALDDANFCRELGAAFDFRLGAITATTARAAFPLRMQLAERYLAPRLALVGDAAHVVHPLAGQGVNLGLRDADELARALIAARDAQRDFAAPAALRIYERRRRSDNALSARAFDAIQRTFASDRLALAAARGAALALVDRIAPLKRLFARHAAGR